MDDAVHVEIEVVEFLAVWVRLGGVRRFFFDGVHHRPRVPVQKPSVK